MESGDSNHLSTTDHWKFSVEIPFSSEKQATIAYNSLRIDKEPRKSEVFREFVVQGANLKMLEEV